MTTTELALGKIRALISPETEIISHEVRNNTIVAIIGKKNVGNFKCPVSSCIRIIAPLK